VLAQKQQDSVFTEYKTVIPGKEYEAGFLHKLFLGAHWRHVWTTPVKAGVLNLERFCGGLTPTEVGGGLQSTTLKFKAADGNEYKFRPLNKDPRAVKLARESSLAKNILQDQISAMNPYASLIANRISQEEGVYHTGNFLTILLDDNQLGEFRNGFGNKVGTIEIIPDEKQFPGSERVIGSIKLLDRMNENYNESVDAKEYLRARLIDAFIGDRDRHKDQWKWVGYKEDEKTVYKPLPTDRDAAFTKLKGIFPSLTVNYFPQLSHFGEDYPSARSITWYARDLDQRFLTFLTKQEWNDVTNEVYSKLTDKLIEDAVKQLPPEVYPKAKDELLYKLKSRRNKLKDFSDEFYNFVNDVVDIYTTDKDDYVIIKPFMNSTEVSIYKGNKQPAGDIEKPLRNKLFDNNVTSEIRIYLQDGDDNARITNGSNLPAIRIIGGKGKDKIINNSDETIGVYDEDENTDVNGNISWHDEKYSYEYEKLLKEYNRKKEHLSEKEKDEYKEKIGDLRYDPKMPPDKFGTTSFFPALDYNSDIGFSFGIRMTHKKYGFRMNPYLYRVDFIPVYTPSATGIKGLGLDLKLDFLSVVNNSSLNFNLRKSGLEIINYFGKGNNTIFNRTLYENKYYKVEHEQYSFNPTLTFPYNSKFKVITGLMIKNFDIKEKESTLVSDIKPYGSNKFSLISGQFGFEYDGRDNKSAPYSGFYLNAIGTYFPKVFSNQSQFGKVSGDLRAYIGHKTIISLALRLKGEKIFGDKYPFFESAFLGGSKSLRGFSRERFAGDASILGTAELRLKLFTVNILIPVTVGTFGFTESGRVFLNGENSKLWHTSYGGGLFMHFVKRSITLKFTGASSKEHSFHFYLNTGFVF
jgi:hypothetical protein